MFQSLSRSTTSRHLLRQSRGGHTGLIPSPMISGIQTHTPLLLFIRYLSTTCSLESRTRVGRVVSQPASNSNNNNNNNNTPTPSSPHHPSHSRRTTPNPKANSPTSTSPTYTSAPISTYTSTSTLSSRKSGSLGSPPATLLIYNQGIARAAFSGLLRASCTVFIGYSITSFGIGIFTASGGADTSLISAIGSTSHMYSFLSLLSATIYSSLLAPFVATVHLQVPPLIQADRRRYAAFISVISQHPRGPSGSHPSHPSRPPASLSSSTTRSSISLPPLSFAAAQAILAESTIHIRTPRLLGQSRLSVAPVSSLQIRSPTGPNASVFHRDRLWPRPWLALANVETTNAQTLSSSSSSVSSVSSHSPPPSLLTRLMTKPRREFFMASGSDWSVQKNSLAPGVWSSLWTLIEKQTTDKTSTTT